MRILFIHEDFTYRGIEDSLRFFERKIRQAAALSPDLILTPELSAGGYGFFKEEGSEWIRKRMPAVITGIKKIARKEGIAMLLGCPWWDCERQQFSNAAIFIDEKGMDFVAHQKIHIIPGSESWATPGETIRTIRWRDYRLGVLICADCYKPAIACELKAQGADVLLSPAAWGPGMYGPNGEWEARSAETGLPLFVCNRTGTEATISFMGSRSGVFHGGRSLVEYKERQPAMLGIEVDETSWLPIEPAFRIIESQASSDF